MTAALARHRMRVVSVRVCWFDDVTDSELAACRLITPACDPGDYVSVTMLERNP